MKLITILLLCSRLLPSLAREEDAQEMDCNDETVFQAVDTALKKYNAGLESGNQFVLYRVTEGTKKDGSKTFYSFKYQIKEGNCSVQSGFAWQDCDFKDAEEAATGECTATLEKRRNNKFSIATQICNITPGKGPIVTNEYHCLGCMHPISVDSPELRPVLKHAVEHFNNNTKHTHLFALGEVKSADRQVVAGMNYQIIYSIVQTNCSKEDFPSLREDCVPLPSGDDGECKGNAFVDIHNTIAGFSDSCEFYPGDDLFEPLPEDCPGCPRNIPVDSPELKEALGHSIAQLNAENNHTFYFKIDTVKKATSQVVAGTKYVIEFIARETKCSKESNAELTADCETKRLGQSLTCNANVYMRPWENKVVPTVKCKVLDMTSVIRRPPGFSPFRAPRVKKPKESTTVSPSYIARVQEERDPGNEQGPIHGHGWLHAKQIKDKNHQGHKHGHGIGHGHQKPHGLGHGHQLKLDDLKQQREDGYDHRHPVGHGHGQRHGHGHGRDKHTNKDKNNVKHTDQRAEPLTSSSEDSTTSTQIQGRIEGFTLNPPLAQPAVISRGFQDSGFTEGVIATTSPYDTETHDDLIPDIHVQPDSLSFKLISDFPEATFHKCPGRPWKPVSRKDPTTETTEFSDFDLLDALS
ncbi:kininogen-1 isoform X1 [Rattus rattus]|uniref:kininogen-1 isoform X1 n=1 Tax=Rattus rattus TaxID=10117 RepID=UPI0013F393FA|nr:kininogen-1 isoform X1 [Rattus rattus]